MVIINEFLLEEFRWISILPNIENNHSISLSMWEWANMKFYLFYRLFIMLFAIGYLLVDIIYESTQYFHRFGYWLIYATNWTFVAFAVLMFLLAVNIVYHFHKKDEANFHEVYSLTMHVMYSTICSSEIVVCIVYWGALSAEKGLMSNIESRLKHTIPLMVVLIDNFISGYIIHLAHVIYPALFGFIYVIFNVIYYKAGGVRYDNEPYVYEAINWNYPLSALTACCLVMVFVFIAHGILFLITLFKIWLKNKTMNQKSNSSENITDLLIK